MTSFRRFQEWFWGLLFFLVLAIGLPFFAHIIEKVWFT